MERQQGSRRNRANTEVTKIAARVRYEMGRRNEKGDNVQKEQ